LQSRTVQPAGEEAPHQIKGYSFTELNDSVRSYGDDLANSREILREKGDLLNVLEEEMADVQERYKLNQEMLKEKDQQIVRLKQELATLQEEFPIRSGEMGPLLANKEKEIKELNGVINIYNYALGDSLRTIEEKSADLDFLNNELVKLQELFHDNEQHYDRRDVRIRVLREALQHERKKEDQRNINLRKMVQSKKKEINELKEHLTATERNLEVVNRVIQEKAAYLDYTKKQLAAYRSHSGPGQEVASALPVNEPEIPIDPIDLSRDEQLGELNGILNIYKEKLSDEHSSAKEKASMIAILEDRLGDMQNQIYEKDKTLARTQDDLSALKERLEAVEIELRNLKNYPQQHSLQNFSIDREVSELQAHFKDLQTFTRESLGL
jgi:chromosome segregation ATPase